MVAVLLEYFHKYILISDVESRWLYYLIFLFLRKELLLSVEGLPRMWQ